MLNPTEFIAHLKPVYTACRRMVRRPAVIERIDVSRRAGQVRLSVSGYHQDGWGVPVRVQQRREDRRVYVSIYREWDVDAVCPAITLPYQATILLDGEFEPGAYTIMVNGQVIEAQF